MTQTFNIANLRHPHYLRDSLDWEIWRDTFEGGTDYRDRYLLKFSERETDAEFRNRKLITPIPTFAKSALLDVRNSIYQRLVGVMRTGGSQQYQDAIVGKRGGVDGEGSTMDAFMGKDVLTELLVMGRVGVYVDAAPPVGDTLADIIYPPYLSYYRVEDILSYRYAPRGKGGEFEAVLLRDWNMEVNQHIGGVELPGEAETRLRLVWKDEFGDVWYRLYDTDGKVIVRDPEADSSGAVLTGLTRVPFVMLDIGESLMKDVASYQQSLLNLSSNDVYYAVKSNSPFLTIQTDAYASGNHLKRPETADGGKGHSETLGAGKGRYYGINEERPQFIAPPTDPLEASMKLQERLEQSIRNLINLAVQNKAGSRTESAESKKIGQGGLEAGLSFIGLEMETAEKKIAQIWAEYENTRNPNPAVVKYPDRYTLKSDSERIEEAQETVKLVEKLPGQELKRVVSKHIARTLLDGKVPTEELESVLREIERGKYLIADPQVTLQAHKSGLVDDVTASEALGYDADSVVEQAKKDRVERAVAVLAAQTNPVDNPAARGVPELDANPNSGADEREEPDPGRVPAPGNVSEES